MPNAMHNPVYRERHAVAMLRDDVLVRMSSIKREHMAIGSSVRQKIAAKLGWMSESKAADVLATIKTTSTPYRLIAKQFAIPVGKVGYLAFKHKVRRGTPWGGDRSLRLFSPYIIANNSDVSDVIGRVNKMTERLAHDIREDVRQELLLAILSGELESDLNLAVARRIAHLRSMNIPLADWQWGRL